MNLTQVHISAVEKLQNKCVVSYMELLPFLKEGLSEEYIKQILLENMKNNGIQYYWYDVGIMVLINENRFRDMQKKDYVLKSPSETVVLKRGNPIFIDLHPMDENGVWADFSSMCIFKPSDENKEKVSFLELVYSIHMEGIRRLNSNMTFVDLFRWYHNKYKENNMSIEDVRRSVGHSLDTGTKKDKYDKDKRLFLRNMNNKSISGYILAIEPGGFKVNDKNELLVGRFEDCVYVPQSGMPIILGRKDKLPLYIN